MSYTFKDDGASLTYYREYNKEVGTGDKTLVGNWVEERALRDVIKTGRYKLWVDPSEDGRIRQQTYTKFTTRPDAIDTSRRTLLHSDHTPSAEYITSNQVPDPGYSVYVNPNKGAREQLMERRAMEMAHKIGASTAEPELPAQYQTTHKQDYIPKELPASETLGRRVMMTQNAVDIKGAGDGLWRKEVNIIARHHFLEENEAGPGQQFSHHGVKLNGTFGKTDGFSTPIELYTRGQEKD